MDALDANVEMWTLIRPIDKTEKLLRTVELTSIPSKPGMRRGEYFSAGDIRAMNDEKDAQKRDAQAFDRGQRLGERERARARRS